MKLDIFEAKAKSVGSINRDIPDPYDGYLWLSHSKLTSLEGCPKVVNEEFDCSNNLLTTLEHSPAKVGKSYICHSNKLVTLKGSPGVINGKFLCGDNKLKTLAGGPLIVNGDYECDGNYITSLEGIHNHIKEIHGILHLVHNNLRSNIIGVLRSRGLKRSPWMITSPIIVAGSFKISSTGTSPVPATSSRARKSC